MRLTLQIIFAFESPDDIPRKYDPDYLMNLNIWKYPEDIEKLLLHPPAPKGQRLFFKKQYGEVDGNEVQKYSNLSKWPTGKETQVIPKQIVPSSS